MIAPDDIVNHLRTYLPAFIDDFHDELTATATASGTTVTVTAVNHGLIVGSKFLVSGGMTSNAIIDAADNGDGTVTFETAQDHDQTRPELPLDTQTLALDGFPEAEWNGLFQIVDIENRRLFTVPFPSGFSTLPTLGDGVLRERQVGLTGLKVVSTVPDSDTFTFETSGFTLPTGDIGELSILSSVARVYGAANIDDAVSLFTRSNATQTKPTVFLIMNDTDVSKDRHSNNDSVASFSPQNLQKQYLLQSFSVVVFLPTENETSGFQAVNKFQTDIYRALTSVLYGFSFDDPDTKQKFVCVNNGFGQGRYDKAFMTYVYDYQVPSVITFENGSYNLQPDVAFRDIASSWGINVGDVEEMELNVDLDDIPRT